MKDRLEKLMQEIDATRDASREAGFAYIYDLLYTARQLVEAAQYCEQGDMKTAQVHAGYASKNAGSLAK